ncbi:MAG TPA: hypothetical protein VJW73_12190 [Gemmatimonadaceae bacterium]|nr:hypothetical protein [Gemmatimonadaceae bacterium]
MFHWLLGVIGAVLAWLAWAIMFDALGEAAWFASGPIRRSVWNRFVAASWPWPLALLMLVGAGAAFLGLQELRPGLAQWRKLAGISAFLGGCGVALVAPFIWRDARRKRERGTDLDQPSNEHRS